MFLNVGHHFFLGLAAGAPVAVDADVPAGVSLRHRVLLTCLVPTGYVTSLVTANRSPSGITMNSMVPGP